MKPRRQIFSIKSPLRNSIFFYSFYSQYKPIKYPGTNSLHLRYNNKILHQRYTNTLLGLSGSKKNYAFYHSYTYTRFGQKKMTLFFFGFCRKLARTKNKQSTDKASKHNGHTVIAVFGISYVLIKRGGVKFVCYT